MKKKKSSGPEYVLLLTCSDVYQADFEGIDIGRFDSDEKAIEFCQTAYKNSGNSKICKIIAATENKLISIKQ